MTKCMLAACTAALLAVSPAAHASSEGDAIVGQWLIDSGDVLIRITRDDTGYSGRIAWLKEPRYPADAIRAGQRKIDLHNPDPSKRSRPLIGLEVLRGFSYDGNDRWSAGTIYDADSGKTYDCTLYLNDSNHLTARGYIGWSVFGRSIHAVRVTGRLPSDDIEAEDIPSQPKSPKPDHLTHVPDKSSGHDDAFDPHDSHDDAATTHQGIPAHADAP